MQRIKFSELPRLADFYNADDFDAGNYVALLKVTESGYRVRDQFGSIETLANPDSESYIDPCENLDASWPDVLEGIAARPNCPRCYRDYIACKAPAMRARQSGDINEAIRLENNCERIYRRMPSYLQW